MVQIGSVQTQINSKYNINPAMMGVEFHSPAAGGGGEEVGRPDSTSPEARKHDGMVTELLAVVVIISVASQILYVPVSRMVFI